MCSRGWAGCVKQSLNESPSEKEGKCVAGGGVRIARLVPLNESPSEKEGKLGNDRPRPVGYRCPQ